MFDSEIYMYTYILMLDAHTHTPSACTHTHTPAHAARRYVVYDAAGRVKPVQGSCFNVADMQVCVSPA